VKLTYFFLYGRKERLLTNPECPKEMFYSYDYFLNKFSDTEIIQFTDDRKGLIPRILKFIDRVLNKLTKLPFFTYNALTSKNIKTINHSDYLVLAQDRIALSILPALIVIRLMNKKINISFFVMGLYNKKPKPGINFRLRNTILNLLFKIVDNIIFLGEGEYNYAIKNYPYLKNKSHLLPFMVDYSFWNTEKISSKSREGILFVGNDSNRDFDLLLKIAEQYPDIKFTFVTKKYKFKKPNLDNVKFIDGSWGNQMISDEELKNLYKKSKITIIPLKNSYQPSGQSVALQSMCVGTPVLITRTDGFWDKSNFVDKEDILFIPDNNINSWMQIIDRYYPDDEFLDQLSEKGLSLIKDKYTSESFHKNFSTIIGI
jgi:glycosyltransferase involved in cell wall biosynthesis